MKYLWLLVSLSFIGCSNIRWITVEKGRIVSENRNPVEILGNPVMSCFNWKNELISEGYFVQQTEDGSFLIDEYGKDFTIIENPNCRLGPNAND